MNAPAKIDDLKLRHTHVGASEVAALFDCSQYLTRFELWHRKAGNIETPAFNAINDDGTPEDERIFWGVTLEDAIFEGAKQRFGYVEREPVPFLTNGRGLGGHPDRRVICPERGPGIVEIKTADWLIRRDWGDEPPASYLLQSQTYQGLDKVEWGDVLVLVGGNKLERFCYSFRPKIFAEIEKRVDTFWQSVRDNVPPPADYTRDLDTIHDLHRLDDGSVADLTTDNLAADACARYLFAQAEASDATKRLDAAKAELLDKLGDAATGLVNGFTVRATTVAGIPEREAEPGEIIKGRKPYRRLTVKERL